MSDISDDTRPKVTMYSAVWCAFCKTEKQYLDSLGIDYVVRDLEADDGAMEELQAKVNGASGIPVTDIDGEIIRGFDRAKIDATLKAKGLLAA